MRALEAIDSQVNIQSSTSTRPMIICATDFISNPIQKPPEIIQGLLHQGSKAVYGGPSKAFKTWSLLHAGIAVNAGCRWFGFETVQSRVLYINLELQDFACQDRIKAIGKATDIDDFSNLDVWNLRGHSTSLDVLIPELLKQISGEGYGLIIPDPIYKTLQGRNELDAGDIGQVCNEIEHLAVQTGAVVMFGAHYAKGNAAGKEAIDRISGSGVWGRDPDTIITATKHELEGVFSVECICRNFPPPEPFCIRWNYPLMERDDRLDPTALKQPQAGRKPVWSMEDILGNLTEPLTTTEWFKRCQTESGITRATFFRLKAQAETSGIIHKHGEKWVKHD